MSMVYFLDFLRKKNPRLCSKIPWFRDASSVADIVVSYYIKTGYQQTVLFRTLHSGQRNPEHGAGMGFAMSLHRLIENHGSDERSGWGETK